MGLLDWLNPVSSAVNAVAGIGSLVDNVTGGADHRAREIARYQFNLNEQAAQNAYDRQLDFWKSQNDYNTPQNQLLRFQQASINPNAVFGQVSNNAASGSSVPQAAPADVSSSLSAQYQKQAMMLQAARQVAETRLIDAQAKNINADTNNKDADTANKEKENTWIDKLRSVEIDLADAQVFKTDKDRAYIQKQIELADEQITEIRTSVDNLKANIANVNQDTLNKLQSYLQSNSSFEKLLKNLDMDIAVKGAQVQHLRTQCALIFSQVVGQNLSNSYQRQINAFGSKTFGDKVSAYRFQRGLLGFEYEKQKIQMPSLRNLGGINNYLNTTQQALDIVNSALDIPTKFFDLSTKPLDTSSKLFNNLSGFGNSTPNTSR